MDFRIDDLNDTDRFGRSLGSALISGQVVALTGPLGSGKTTLVRSIAAGAGVQDLRQVNSPTFVIVNEYEGRRDNVPLRLYHIDAYRLHRSEDLEALGFDEMCSFGTVLIEWADRVADLLPANRLTVELTPVDECRRRFRCIATGSTATASLEALLPENDSYTPV